MISCRLGRYVIPPDVSVPQNETRTNVGVMWLLADGCAAKGDQVERSKGLAVGPAMRDDRLEHAPPSLPDTQRTCRPLRRAVGNNNNKIQTKATLSPKTSRQSHRDRARTKPVASLSLGHQQPNTQHTATSTTKKNPVSTGPLQQPTKPGTKSQPQKKEKTRWISDRQGVLSPPPPPPPPRQLQQPSPLLATPQLRMGPLRLLARLDVPGSGRGGDRRRGWVRPPLTTDAHPALPQPPPRKPQAPKTLRAGLAVVVVAAAAVVVVVRSVDGST